MNLVYQAYGRDDVIGQVLFSCTTLLSRLSENSSLKVIIYTDQGKRLRSFFTEESRVHIEEVEPKQIQVWRGDIDFVHRVKIEILKNAANKWQNTVLYADGDTFFNADPTERFKMVSDDVSLMHLPENALSEGRDPLSKKICKFVRKESFHVDSSELKVSENTVMWNAGVIGVSTKNCSMFKDILELTDQMYSKYPKHVMEQLAVSVALQKKTKVLRTDDIIGHYWNQKDEFQTAIDSHLEKHKTLSQSIENLRDFQWPRAPKPKPKGIKKILHKLFR